MERLCSEAEPYCAGPARRSTVLFDNLAVGLLMAIRALDGSGLARSVLSLVAIDAGSRCCGGIMKRALQVRGHGRRRRPGMTIGASLLRRL